MDSNGPPEVELTVLRVFKPEEVFPEPVTPTRKDPCSIFQEGDTYTYHGFEQPDGFCPIAWQTLLPYAMTLYKGGDFTSWYGEEGVAIICCPDGRRPVVFRLERKPRVH